MENFKRQLISVINEADLPFEAKVYVLKDVYRELMDLYEQLLIQQHQEELTTKEVEQEQQDTEEKSE